MLDIVQLMKSEGPAQRIDANLIDETQGDMDDSSFILLMAQVLLQTQEDAELPVETKVSELDTSLELSQDDMDTVELDLEALNSSNQALRWINADDYLPPANTVDQDEPAVTASQVANLLQASGETDKKQTDAVLLKQESNTQAKSAILPGDLLNQDAEVEMADDAEPLLPNQILGDAKAKEPFDYTELTTLANLKPSQQEGSSTKVQPNILAMNLGQNQPAALIPTSPSATAHALHIPTDVAKGEWGDQFNQHIMWLGQQKIKTAMIKINPPELGPLEITLKMDKQSAQLNINSHSIVVRDALDQALPRLREMMNEQGLQLGQVNIESNAKNQEQQTSSQSQTEYGSDNDLIEDQAPEEITSTRRVLKGLIDYFA